MRLFSPVQIDACGYFQGQGWMCTVIHSPELPGAIWEREPLDGARGNRNLMGFVSLGLFHVFIAREVD